MALRRGGVPSPTFLRHPEAASPGSPGPPPWTQCAGQGNKDGPLSSPTPAHASPGIAPITVPWGLIFKFPAPTLWTQVALGQPLLPRPHRPHTQLVLKLPWLLGVLVWPWPMALDSYKSRELREAPPTPRAWSQVSIRKGPLQVCRKVQRLPCRRDAHTTAQPGLLRASELRLWGTQNAPAPCLSTFCPVPLAGTASSLWGCELCPCQPCPCQPCPCPGDPGGDSEEKMHGVKGGGFRGGEGELGGISLAAKWIWGLICACLRQASVWRVGTGSIERPLHTSAGLSCRHDRN